MLLKIIALYFKSKLLQIQVDWKDSSLHQQPRLSVIKLSHKCVVWDLFLEKIVNRSYNMFLVEDMLQLL